MDELNDYDGSAADRTAAAVDLLRKARAGSELHDFPESCRPLTRAAAYSIQAAMAPGLGPIGGWKVGAPSPQAEPMCSPLPISGILSSPAAAPGPLRYRGIEAEIAFRIGRDLPARQTDYSRAEIVDSLASCHPVIELVECRFAEMDKADHLSALADLQNHGALIVGAAWDGWRNIAFENLTVRLEINGRPVIEKTGSNPAVDLIGLVTWLANIGSRWAGGLKASEIVTTGSWIGKLQSPALATVVAYFDGFQPVEAMIG